MKLYISPSNNPFFNIASEEYFVKSFAESGTIIFIYVNAPSVIIGRNQNPWKEANISCLLHSGIPLVRRISGGGTVYHDEGNINLSFITDRTEKNFNNYREFTQPAINYLKSIGIPAELNKRNDIVIGERKISGNAQFSSKNRLLSHGTLLVSADLDKLQKTLNAKDLDLVSISTNSTRSKVTSLSDYLNYEISVEEVIKGIVEEFGQFYELEELQLSDTDINEISRLTEKFNSYSWIYGRTHKFHITDQSGKLSLFVEDGIICEIRDSGEKISLNPDTKDVHFLPNSIEESAYDVTLKSRLLKAFF